MTTTRIERVDILAQHIGFADPPSRAGKLEIDRIDGKRFQCVDALSGSRTAIAASAVDLVLEEALKDVRVLQPEMFGCSAEVLESHFGSVWTDDYPSLLVNLWLSSGAELQCFTESYYVFLLPFSVRNGGSEICSFNRGLSEAIAGLMPEEFLHRCRLLDGDEVMQFEQEHMSSSAALAPETTEVDAGPQLSSADINGLIASLFDRSETEEQRQEAESTGDISSRLLQSNSLDTVRDLLSRGADPSIADEVGQTALMHACMPPCDAERFQLLVAAGADVEAAGPGGFTGLQLSCQSGEAAAVGEWIRAGADVNVVGPAGSSPLMLGALWERVVEELLKAGADVKVTDDDDGHSAIVYLILAQSPVGVAQQLQSLDLLLEAGVDLTQVDQAGMTALDHAEQAVLRCEIEDEVCAKISAAREVHEPDEVCDLLEEPTDAEPHVEFDMPDYDKLIATKIRDRIVAWEKRS